MNYVKCCLFIALCAICSCNKKDVDTNSRRLQKRNNSFHGHKGYVENAYPLGFFTKEHYKQVAVNAQSILDELTKIDVSGLSETEQISLGFLQLNLQDKLDHNTFECYLNPNAFRCVFILI